MKASDEELVVLLSRCSLKDQLALEKLYNHVAPFLNHVAYQILRSEALSNEALQDAFLQIWNNAASYREDLAKPLTWMCSIVRYRALDMLRVETKHGNRPDYEQELLEIEQAKGDDEPELEVGRQQNQSSLHDCLNSLETDVKHSIKLAYLKGYSREEIANALDAKVNTVKSWLRRGSQRLKKCLTSKIEATE